MIASVASIHERVATYYEGRLRDHGATARGVDWRDEESQRLRFEQLARVLDYADGPVCVNDFGCGYGAMASFLESRQTVVSYAGYDISEAMIRSARSCQGQRSGRRFTSSRSAMAVADFTLASGLFNVRLDVDSESWRLYVLDTIADLARLSRIGFAFNCLTRYCHPERMEERLHYADPLALFDHCQLRYSRWVTLLHDYGLFEFTVLVRASEAGVWQKS